MTDSGVDAEQIKKTQDALGKYVKKPPLSEKLLRKPPFKFILDIVKAVVRDTSFLQDLYDEDELVAEKDRDGKMKFLQKLIDAIKLVTKQDLQVKTSKIVAGLEADKTNELFQAIAYALDHKLDSAEAVKIVRGGGNAAAAAQSKTKPAKSEQKVKAVAKVGSKQPPPSRDRTPAKPELKKQLTSQKSIEKKNPAREKATLKEKPVSKSKANVSDARKLKKAPSSDSSLKIEEKIMTNGSHDSFSPPRQSSQEKNEPEVEVAGENHAEIPQQQSPPVESAEDQKENTEPKESEEEPKVNGDVNHTSETNGHAEVERDAQEMLPKPQDELAAIIDEEAEYRRKERSKKLSSRHRRQKSVEGESPEKQPEAPQPQAIANEAKQQLPQDERIERFKSGYKRESFDRPRTSLRPPSARPASSRPAAPRRRDKNVEIVLQPESTKLGSVQVMMENFSVELEDDGENLVIIEDPSASNDAADFLNERLAKNSSSESMPSDHGVLVQQILETEKNFEGALGMDGSGQLKKTEIEFDDSRSQSSAKQIESLKELIQKLVRSLNPMGKLMDYVQEDIDSMQREHVKWNEIYKQAAIDLKREQNETQTAIEPLKFQLNQLEKSIVEHRQLIDEMRGNLMMSEQKINKIFTDG